jgi:hypothetical protein
VQNLFSGDSCLGAVAVTRKSQPEHQIDLFFFYHGDGKVSCGLCK